MRFPACCSSWPFALVVSALIFFPTLGLRAAPATDPFAGDSRLAVRQTIAVHDRGIQDLLADLELRTGIRFFADPSVAEDRVTLTVHERPLADTLRVLARFFGFTWTRSGTAPDYGYALAQSPESAAQEEAVLNARLKRAVAAISDEAEDYARFEHLPEAEVLQRAEETARQLDTETDPARRRTLMIEHAACAQILSRSEWRSLVNRLIHAFTPDQIQNLIQAGATEYVWPAHIGFREVPPEAIPRSVTGSQEADSGGRITFFRVRFMGAPGRRPRLAWHVVAGRQRAHAFDVTESSGELPDVDPDSGTQSPPAPPGPPGSDAALSVHVSVDVKSDTSGAAHQDGAPARPSLGETLIALDRAHPLDIVADAFCSSRVSGYQQEDRPISEALDRLAGMTDHRWWRDDGFVLVKSNDYEADRAAEPPSDALARWARAAELDRLSLDDYAEMAALPDQKLDTLVQMSVRGDFPAQLAPVTQVRDHLKLWSALTRTQRREARSQGVSWSEMSDAQRKLLMLATTDQHAGTGFRILPMETLVGLRMRLESHETRLWGVRRGPGGSVSGVGSRDLALRQFQRADPALKLEDVKTVVFSTDAFVYENDRGMVVARVWLTVPPRWEDAPVGS